MTNNIIPSTKTPDSIIIFLSIILILLGMFLYSLIGIWGILIILVLLASSTPLYTKSNIPAFNALILINSFTGNMRVVFPGINFKLPWEIAQHENGERKYIDLRVDLTEVCNESYPSLNALMNVKYVYTIKPNISESSGETAEEKIIKFSSFEPDAIKSKGKALFSMLISDYYGINKGEDLLNKDRIIKEIFGTEENKKDSILEFEKKHGVEVVVILKESYFNEQTQKFRNMVSASQSFDEAISILTSNGMEKSEAEKIVKLMNLDGYTEKDFNLNVKAPDLKNLRDATILGGLINDNKGGKNE